MVDKVRLVSVVLWILVAVVALVALLWLGGLLFSRTVVRHNAARAAVVLGAAGDGDLQETAAMLGPGKGFGLLRLTPDELVFANGSSDEITRFERTQIRSAVPSADPQGATKPLRRPALVVTTVSGEAMAIAVADVGLWIQRLS